MDLAIAGGRKVTIVDDIENSVIRKVSVPHVGKRIG